MKRIFKNKHFRETFAVLPSVVFPRPKDAPLCEKSGMGDESGRDFYELFCLKNGRFVDIKKD
jgi:hypothetical protein